MKIPLATFCFLLALDVAGVDLSAWRTITVVALVFIAVRLIAQDAQS